MITGDKSSGLGGGSQRSHLSAAGVEDWKLAEDEGEWVRFELPTNNLFSSWACPAESIISTRSCV
jgi:hypothetical protein